MRRDIVFIEKASSGSAGNDLELHIRIGNFNEWYGSSKSKWCMDVEVVDYSGSSSSRHRDVLFFTTLVLEDDMLLARSAVLLTDEKLQFELVNKLFDKYVIDPSLDMEDDEQNWFKKYVRGTYDKMMEIRDSKNESMCEDVHDS